jgi:hypothetical protein
VISVLDGIGIQPQLATQNYNFGSMVVGSTPVTQKVRFWLPPGSLYRDTVRITGFRFRTDQGSGGQPDFTRLPLDSTLQLIPGVRDTVEFTGAFQAQAGGNRTAEMEALTVEGVNVTSFWNGTGITLASGITGTGGNASGLCVGQSADILATVTNTGAVDLSVDSLRMSGGDFTVTNPDPNVPFVVKPGETKSITVHFAPAANGVQSAQLFVYNSTGTRLDLPINGSALAAVVNTVTQLSGTKGQTTELGADLGFSVSLPAIPPGTAITSYRVTITYDAAELLPRNAAIKLGGANPAGGTATVNSGSTKGTLIVDVTLPTPLTNGGELLAMPFGVVFDTIPTRMISATVTAVGANCLEIIGSADTIGVEPICGLTNRLIELTSGSYTLDQNRPNPFNPVTVIRYSLGLDGPTQIYLYDAQGKLVQKLIDEYEKPGVYELTLDVSNLPSGNYYYKLVSGQWSQTKMLTVVK